MGGITISQSATTPLLLLLPLLLLFGISAGLQSLCEYLISTGQIVDKEVCRVIFRTIRIRGIWYHRVWRRCWMPIICVFSFIAWWSGWTLAVSRRRTARRAGCCTTLR